METFPQTQSCNFLNFRNQRCHNCQKWETGWCWGISLDSKVPRIDFDETLIQHFSLDRCLINVKQRVFAIRGCPDLGPELAYFRSRDFQVLKEGTKEILCSLDHPEFSNMEIMQRIRTARQEEQLAFIYARLIPDDLANSTQPMEEFISKCSMDGRDCKFSWVYSLNFPQILDFQQITTQFV